MKTIFNPENAMRTANWLEEETNQLFMELRRTVKELNELRPLWNDSQFQAFLILFDDALEKVNKFDPDAKQYVAYLRKKSRIISEFLK